MTRPDEYTVYQATDPGTSPSVLEAMAGARPDLRQFVAANSATAPEVLEWLGSLGDPAVAAALARRQAGQGSAWASPVRDGQAPDDHPGGGPYGADGPGQSYGTAEPVNPYAAPAGGNPYGPPAGGNPYGPPAGGNPYGPPAGGNPYRPPADVNPYGPPASPAGAPGGYGPHAGFPQPPAAGAGSFGQQGYGGSGQVPTPGDLQAGYGYAPAPQSGSRKGLVIAIVVGAVLLIGALIVAATMIFSSISDSGYGEDTDLDGLWDQCADGDMAACDTLYWDSPLNSEYEEFGDTCGGRQAPGTGEWCEDAF